MADLNALIAQGAQFKAPPDPFAQYAQMQQIQQGRNQNALAQYTLGKARQEDVTRNAMNQAYASNLNLETGEINYPGLYKSLAGAEAGASIPGIQKTQFETQTAQANLNKIKGETRKQLLDFENSAKRDLSLNPSPENIRAYGQDAVIKGFATPEQAAAKVAQYLAMKPEELKAMLSASGATAGELKPTLTPQTLGGTTQVLSTPAFGGTASVVPGSTGTVTNTPFQTGTLGIGTERNRIAQGQLNVAKQRLDAEMATGNLTPATIDFIAETYRQTGTLPPMGMGPRAAAARSQILTRAGELSMAGGATAAQAATNVAQNKQDIAGQTAAVKDFSAGPSSKKTTAVSTALNHLETMDRLTDALGNGDMKLFNLAANKLGEQAGKPAPTNMDAAAELVGAEVIKAIVLNGGTGKERDKAAATFANAKSPDQLKGAANTYRELLGGQLTTLAQQYETGTGRKDFTKKLSPAAIKLLGVSTPAPVAPTSSGGHPSAIQAIIDAQKGR
jgi:hypothetical protein